MTGTRLLVAAVAMLIATAVADAGLIAYGPQAFFGSQGGTINIAAPITVNAVTVTELTVILQGDLGTDQESVEVFVEGTSVGTIGPRLTSTGSFGTPQSLLGGSNFNFDPFFATATLALDVAGAVLDGTLDLTFVATTDGVANFNAAQIGQGPFEGLDSFTFAVAGDLTFTECSVPEPSTLAVFALGSIGIVAGGIRRRRKQRR